MPFKQKELNEYKDRLYYNRKNNRYFLIGGIVFIVLIMIGLVIFFTMKSSFCNNKEDQLVSILEAYGLEHNLLPTVEGDSVTLYLDEVENSEPIENDKLTCSGSVKFTKYKDTYIKTFDLTGCGSCTTKTRYKSWGKETENYNSKKRLIDVVPYYNYYGVESYQSSWSKWLASNNISETATDGVKLPIDEKQLPTIPKEAIITKIEKQDKTVYSYRDKRFKWYDNANTKYSALASEAPKGYPNKDSATRVTTPYTEWSLNYPEVKSYRHIATTTGFRWYYLDGDEKIYWNSGAYTPNQPANKYNKKEKETVKMYRYQDEMWRWYTGVKRNYSNFSSTALGKYKYKDAAITDYTNWSNWKDTSSINSSNKSYREEKTDINSRYRIQYNMVTFLKLEEYVDKEELERRLNGSLTDIAKRTDLALDVHYKYIYAK